MTLFGKKIRLRRNTVPDYSFKKSHRTTKRETSKRTTSKRTTSKRATQQRATPKRATPKRTTPKQATIVVAKTTPKKIGKFYKILKCNPSCTDAMIKKNYKKLALQYHPDKHPGNENLFKQLVEAYAVLSDPVRRKKYDEKY